MTKQEKYLVYISATGEVVRIDQPTRLDLRLLQTLVGGYIEHVGGIKYEGHDCYMWCNEEGKLKGLPINTKATEIFQKAHGPVDVIVGDVVVVIGLEG